MKYAVFTVQTPRYDWKETAAKLKQYGYDGIEWRVGQAVKDVPTPLPPEDQWYWQYNKATLDVGNIAEDARMIQQITQEQGLRIVSLTTYLTPDKKLEIEAVMKAAKEIGCPMIRINPYAYDGQTHYQKIFDQMHKELEELQELCRMYGVRIVLEIHMGNIIPSASAARRMLDGLDSSLIGVIYDAGNMVHEGYEQYKLGMELLGGYLHHIHIKDAKWTCQKDKDTMNYKVEWCPIGDGVVDFEKLLCAAKSVGYDGYLSFEDFSNEDTDEAKLARNITVIQQLERRINQ